MFPERMLRPSIEKPQKLCLTLKLMLQGNTSMFIIWAGEEYTVSLPILIRIGPVWNVDDFTVQLAKEGFEFHAKTNNPHNFESVKLSQLIIQFLDSTTKLPLSDVLISISGGTNNIRSKNFTDNSGILNFIGLV
jgi:hypothetical protein